MKAQLHSKTVGAAAIAMILSILAAAPSGHAAAIPIINPSFESPDVFDQTYYGDIDGWGETGGAPLRGLCDPDSSRYADATGNAVPLPGTADGFQVGMVRDTLALLAQSGGALQPDTSYTLTVAFVDPLLGDPAGWIQLVHSPTGEVLAENKDFPGIDGTFVDRTASFTTGDTVSGEVIIVLRSDSGGNEAHYDKVRLDATSTRPVLDLNRAATGVICSWPTNHTGYFL